MTRARQIAFMVAMLGLVWVPVQAGQLMAKLGFSTVGTEPSILTAAEIEKVILIERSKIVELPIPIGEKPPEKSTIEVGTRGLNAAELAKAHEVGARSKTNIAVTPPGRDSHSQSRMK